MFKLRFFLSIIVFSCLLIFTSFLKNKTRDIEKKINNLKTIVFKKEKDFKESQLDLFYLTSPTMIEQKIQHLDQSQYVTMEFSNIFLSMQSFLDLENKFVTTEEENDEKKQKN